MRIVRLLERLLENTSEDSKITGEILENTSEDDKITGDITVV